MRVFFLVIILPMVAANLAWWLWADRHARPLRRARVWRTAVAAFVLLQLAAIVWIMLSRWVGVRFGALPGPVLATIFVWNLVIAPLSMLIVLVMWAGRKIGVLATALARRPADEPSVAARVEDQPPRVLDAAPVVSGTGPTRRQVLTAAVAAVPPLLAISTTGISLSQLNGFRVRRFNLSIPTLPAALEGLTIAHVSDVHVGGFTPPNVLEQIVETTNGMRPDLVLLTGDLINHSLSDLPQGLEIVQALRPRFGLAMCEGNHDLFEGRDRFIDRVKSAGVPLLVNETMGLSIRGQTVQLLGMAWGEPRRPGSGPGMFDLGMRTLLPQIEPGAFPILLAHHPHALDHAAEAGLPLTLAGHTHGGQLMLSRHIGAGSFLFKYLSGLYHNGDSQLVVSNGVGNWFPLRTQAPAEILHLTLRQGTAA